MTRTRRQTKDKSTESNEAPTSSVEVSDDLTQGQGTNSDMTNNMAAGSEESAPAETSAAHEKTSSPDGILYEANVSKKRSKWDPSRVLTDPSSPLTSVNLRVRTRRWTGRLLANYFSASSQVPMPGMRCQMIRNSSSPACFQIKRIFCPELTVDHQD